MGIGRLPIGLLCLSMLAWNSAAQAGDSASRGLGGYRDWRRAKRIEATTRFLIFRAGQLAEERAADQ